MIEPLKHIARKVLPDRVLAKLKTAKNRSKMEESLIIYDFFKGLESEDRTLVNVGAHRGAVMEPFVLLGWDVYAFEPDPKNRIQLEAKYREYPNVTIDDRCVSDVSQTNQPFFTSEVSSGISSLSAFDSSHEVGTHVDVTTLTEALPPDQMIDFLLIDAEGYDLPVLKGYPWEQNPPLAIVCEFEDMKTEPLGYRFTDLARFLEEKGYRILVSEWFPVVRYGAEHRWRRFETYPCELEDPKAWGNLIAVQGDDNFEAVRKLARARESRYRA